MLDAFEVSTHHAHVKAAFSKRSMQLLLFLIFLRICDDSGHDETLLRFRNCQMSASSCDGVVAIVFLWDAVCIGLGGSFRMPNPINIDVEFDLVLAAKSEFGY